MSASMRGDLKRQHHDAIDLGKARPRCYCELTGPATGRQTNKKCKTKREEPN